MAVEEEQEPWGILINLGQILKWTLEEEREDTRFCWRNQSDTQKSNLYIITKGVGETIWVKIIQGKQGHVTFWEDSQKR